MNEILVARNAFADDLDQLGGREVGDDDRRAARDHRRVELAQLPSARSEVDAEDQPVGLQGVLDGEALAEELRVPRQLGVAGGASFARRAASRAAVPTGTVDLPTTSAAGVRCGASASTAAST